MKPLLSDWKGKTKIVQGALALMDVLDGSGADGLHTSSVDLGLIRLGVDPRWKAEYARWCRSRGIAVVATRGKDAVWRLLPLESSQYRAWLHVMSEAHYSETIHAIRATSGTDLAAAQQSSWKGSAFSLGIILGKSPSLIADEMEPLSLAADSGLRDRLVDAGYLA
jgi:hypothetical protein